MDINADGGITIRSIRWHYVMYYCRTCRTNTAWLQTGNVETCTECGGRREKDA